MHINFILISLVILGGLLFSINDCKKTRKWYILSMLMIFLLLVTFRNLSVGVDTYRYYERFNDVCNMSWQEVWDALILRYKYSVGEYDAGYILLQKIISIFTNNWHVFVFLVNLIFFIPLGILLYKNTTHIIQLVLAFIFYIAIIQISPMSGGRQNYARGMCIIALLLMFKDKYLKASICIIIGSLFHASCLLFFLPLLLSKLNSKLLKSLHIISFLCIGFVIMYGGQIVQFMGDFIGIERYSEYGDEVMGGGLTFTILIMAISLFCFISIRESDMNNNVIYRKLYVMLPLMTFFAPLISVDGAMIRVSSYFHHYLIILMPIAIDLICKKNHKDRQILYCVFIVLLSFFVLKDGGLIYYFA